MRFIRNELRGDGVLFQLASEDHVNVLGQLFDGLSRGSVQSNARIKAEFAPCLLRGEVSARLGDVVDAATRLLDRQRRRPGCRFDVQRRRLCRVGSGSGAVEMPIAEDDSVDWRRGIVSRSSVATPATVIARV